MAIDPYSFGEYIEARIAEHEIFISFNNDSDAYIFHEWWAKEGKDSFEKYHGVTTILKVLD